MGKSESGSAPVRGKGGPKTPRGNANASRNAMSHGILGKGLLLEDEDPAEFKAIKALREAQPLRLSVVDQQAERES